MKSLEKTDSSSSGKAVANIKVNTLFLSGNHHSMLQPKLKVGEPNDEYEREADQVADRVIRMPEPFIQQQEDGEELIQTKLSTPFLPKHEDKSIKVSRKEKTNNIRSQVKPWQPIKINPVKKEGVIQRRINYLAQVTGQHAAPFLTAFDNTVTQVEQSLVGVTGTMATDVRAAMARARALRSAGRVTCWQISGGLVYASYDNATGEIRLHTNWGVGQPTSRRTVIHESIHALHGQQHQALSRMYAQVLAAGGTTNTGLGIALLQFKAWTEYWAYRRTQEHYNLIHPQHASDAHQSAMGERDVRRSIAATTRAMGRAFTPWTWSPPAQHRTVRRRRSQ